MVEFIVRARAAPVDPDTFRSAIGRGQGVEYLADITKAALLVSKGHREDVVLHLVLEKSRDFSRIISIAGDHLGSLPDLQESSLLDLVVSSLQAGRALGKDDSVTTEKGVFVSASSFEKLVKEKSAVANVFLMDAEGEDIRTTDLQSDSVFVLTDHTPMPRNTFRSMARQGVKPVSLGPVTLHASQCISIVLNEIDRR